MDDRSLNQLIAPVLRDRLARFGFDHCEVHSGEDYDGDPVIYVDIHYRADQSPLDGETSLSAIRAVREALARVGETRFPHLRHFYPDDELAEDPADAAE